MKTWYVYILLCRDDTLYTGITTDLQRRLRQHNAGTGAKYTRGRGPVVLLFHEECATKGEALKRELVIKAMPRPQKLELVKLSQGKAGADG